MRVSPRAHVEHEQTAVGVRLIDAELDGLQLDRPEAVDAVGGGGSFKGGTREDVIGLRRSEDSSDSNRTDLHGASADGRGGPGVGETAVEIAGE